MRSFSKNLLALGVVLALPACAMFSSEEAKVGAPATAEQAKKEKIGSISGDKNGFVLFGGKKKQGGGEGTGGIGVNAYLWKATVSTISFMPLNSADPFGGVIVTDWYSAPEAPNERLKLNVFIMDQELRSDGVKVSVFKQIRQGATWQDAPVASETARGLEDAILTKARQLRVEALQGG
jgi:hypothetical protein